MNKIWLYWEGEKMPDYYRLCQETIKHHHNEHDVCLIGDSDLSDLIGPVPEILKKCYVTHRVDWIRKMLLYKQGGLYIDSDFICLRPLTVFQQMSEVFDHVYYKRWNNSYMDNFVGARAGSPIMKTAADYCLERFELKSGKVNWYEASTSAIDHAMQKHWFDCLHARVPTHSIVPKSGFEHQWFFEPTDEIPNNNCFGFMTSFHSFHKHVAKLTRAELLAMPNRLGAIFRKALA